MTATDQRAPQLTLRRADDRGHFDHGWLKAKHSFSFGHYFDPQHVGFRSLRVINEDVISGGTGFPTHPHRNMEILTYVTSGAIEHQDNAGNYGVVKAGEVQRMTAGSGIRHSEANASANENLELLQIWIHPKQSGLTPGYEQKAFNVAEYPGQWQLIASPDGSDGSLTIHQDAKLFAIRLDPGQSAQMEIARGRGAWLQVVEGSADVQAVGGSSDSKQEDGNNAIIQQGDGLAMNQISEFTLTAGDAGAEILAFDLA